MSKDDKRKLAVALKYDKDKNEAPQVIAKGSGEVARSIIKKGEQEGIPKDKRVPKFHQLA